jgi:SAM-dependent methyltransferase
MHRTPKSNTEWTYWGEVDPLFGVCSLQGKSRTNRDPWNEDDFYAQAKEEFATNLKHWRQYGMVTESCVEIGCGAGRMTRCLQDVFGKVHACDVAAGMLAFAKKNTDPRIVTTYQTNGTSLPLPDGSVTAAYSTIVFQHFDDPSVGIAYFHELYRVMKPGSTFLINLPWHQWPNALITWPYKVANVIARGWDRVACGFQRFLIKLGPSVMKMRVGRRLGELMAATSYDFPWLMAELDKIGFRDIEVRTYYVPIEGRHHPFFFGTKK